MIPIYKIYTENKENTIENKKPQLKNLKKNKKNLIFFTERLLVAVP